MILNITGLTLYFVTSSDSGFNPNPQKERSSFICVWTRKGSNRYFGPYLIGMNHDFGPYLITTDTIPGLMINNLLSAGGLSLPTPG